MKTITCNIVPIKTTDCLQMFSCPPTIQQTLTETSDISHLISFGLQLRASLQVFPRLPGLIFVVPRYWSQLDAGPVRALRLLCSNFEIIWRYLNFSNLYFPKPRLCQIYGYDKSNNLFPLWYQQFYDNSVHCLGRKIVLMISQVRVTFF